jgi:nicotinamide-nucleotide amidase
MTMVRSAELIAVGTELLLGEIVDTNSAYLARELAARSVDV